MLFSVYLVLEEILKYWLRFLNEYGELETVKRVTRGKASFLAEGEAFEAGG